MSDPPSTNDIIIDRAMLGMDCQRCVDWAIGMLMHGHETDYLGRLAGQLPPFDRDEIGLLRDCALEELGFADLSSETLVCSSLANALQKHQGNVAMTNSLLESARQLYIERNIHDLQSLYLLAYGLQDLEEFGQQWYVEDMDQSNASTIARRMIDQFIRRYANAK